MNARPRGQSGEDEVALWTARGTGRPAADDVVGSRERCSWPWTLGFGLQHVLAMFGTTVLVPRLTGFPATTTLLLSGLGTLLFLVVTRHRVPNYLGASLAFVVPLAVAANKTGARPAVLLGAVVVVGLLVVAVGIAVKALGVRLLEAAMPPVVSGGVVLLVGLCLAPQAVSAFGEQLVPGTITLGALVLATVATRGTLSRVAILAAVLLGWAYAALAGELDPARVAELARAPWFGAPELIAPRWDLTAVPFALPLVVVLVAQHVANLKVIAAMTGRNLDSSVGDALIGGGLATTLSGSAGGSALTSYGSNVGVMAVTRVYSTAAVAVAAAVAVLLSFSPKLGALIGTVPAGVFGGAALVLFGVLAVVGLRIWGESGVDFADPVNLVVLGTALVAGVGDLTISLGALRITGLVWGSIGIVLLYPLLRRIADSARARAGEPANSGS